MNTIELIITLVSAIGGIEAVKWLYTRKASARLADAQAEGEEWQTLQSVTEFLQAQLKDKEERFAEQTTSVRNLNRELLEAERKMAALEVELVKVRCDDLKCPFRIPPNVYTPQRGRMTKEKYFNSRENET